MKRWKQKTAILLSCVLISGAGNGMTAWALPEPFGEQAVEEDEDLLWDRVIDEFKYPELASDSNADYPERGLEIASGSNAEYDMLRGAMFASVWGDDYPYRGGPIDAHDPWRHFTRECTSFCCWCLVSRNGLPLPFPFSDHARGWDDKCRALGYTVDRNPAVGSIAYWDGGTWGHVAWVADVDGDNVRIQEYNFNFDYNYYERIINRWNPNGYIHIKDIVQEAPPQPLPHPDHSAPEIEDGEYQIYSAVGENKVVVTDPSNQNNANVYLWDQRYTNQFKWILERQSDDSFKIASSYNGKVLDVDGAYLESKINIKIYDWVGGDNQRFYIVSDGDGWCRIVAKHSGRVLDVEGRNSENGTNIWQYEPNGTIAQKFKLVKAPQPLGHPANSDPALKDGGYIIHSALDQNKVLSLEENAAKNGSNIFLWENNRHSTQQWTLERQTNGSFRITSLHNGGVVDAEAAAVGNGVNILTWEWFQGPQQYWYIVKNADGTHTLIANHSGYAMDVSASQTANGTNIQQWEPWGGETNKAQRFILERYPAPTMYRVSFKGKDGVVLSIQDVEQGDAAVAPQAPAVQGYRFVRWDKAFNHINSELTVNAVYEALPSTGGGSGTGSGGGGGSTGGSTGGGGGSSAGGGSGSSTGGSGKSSGGGGGGGRSRGAGTAQTASTGPRTTSGAISSGGVWQKEADGSWSYLKNGSKITESWIQEGGNWFRVNGQGRLFENTWLMVNGRWFYAESGGYIAQNKWLYLGGRWYYTENGGYTVMNQWLLIGGKWYHFDASGALSASTTVDGYQVNQNGEWVQ